MAAKKSTGRSTAQKTATKRSSGGKTSQKKVPVKEPLHREIGAFICLFLGVLTIFGCFGVDAVLIRFITNLLKGLVGPGFYILPFVFTICFIILLLHGGRPVKMRIICSFLLALSIGAIVHLVSASAIVPWSWKMGVTLYQAGVAGTGGGLIAGFFAMLFELCFSKVGAVILFILAFIVELLAALNMTVLSIIRAIQNRPRPEYEEPEEVEDTATRIVNHVAQKHIERVERKRAASEFDLPVDEPPMVIPTPEKPLKKRKIQSPDEYLMESQTDGVFTAAKEKEAEKLQQSQKEQRPVTPVPPEKVEPEREEIPVPVVMPELILPQESVETVKKEEAMACAQEIAQEIASAPSPEAMTVTYCYPPVTLLHSGSGMSIDGTEEMRENTERLNSTLMSFGIEAHIINVTRGPSVTRYELELERGVKLSKITNLSDDIALSLGATGVRISAIPEKISVVGIEVPNRTVSTVYARDVIGSDVFQKSKSRISFAVGKDISGNCIVGDIAKLPHMLIAGTTGSGKSVCMNTLIISLLYKSRPEEVRLIMVDPKMVELGVYNGIPHLLIPVVTDPKKAAGALQWAVTEMMRRYRMMADAGVRDLDSYNKLTAGDDERESMAQIVVVIDELADLMLVAAKEVEESICRIAQMGRASGIHLIIATQRPSADVITGLMKANIPSRIAFAVASAMESRIILDTPGAEKLVGKGDMLYAPLGQGKPRRIQGCFITDEEVQDVVNFIKGSQTAEYSQDIMEQIEKRAEQSGKSGAGTASPSESADDHGDELLPQAVEIILETNQASVSMLQRRLKLGYARAARIVDEMEEKGIVGPYEGSKPRQVLITKEQWIQMQNPDASPQELGVEEEIP